MIVPQYWAEARLQQKHQGKQITVRRFGWSDTDQASAQASADMRAQEAMSRLLAGEKLERREPKMPYNGASGVPIREEIVSRHGSTIITRNAYGARCLNTPHALFADIDFPEKSYLRIGLRGCVAILLMAAAIGWLTHSPFAGIAFALLAFIASGPITRWIQRRRPDETDAAETLARSRVTQFAQEHTDWGLRLYRTPAGLRVLATHQPFDPADPAVDAFFKAVQADAVYAAMCHNQQCFRARVSPKPWRIGIQTNMRPRPGVWPIKPEQLGVRNAWIAQYEAQAPAYAACRFVETLGSGVIHPDIQAVQELHDTMCQATQTQMPLA